LLSRPSWYLSLQPFKAIKLRKQPIRFTDIVAIIQ
jgi:hypothetical protein